MKFHQCLPHTVRANISIMDNSFSFSLGNNQNKRKHSVANKFDEDDSVIDSNDIIKVAEIKKVPRSPHSDVDEDNDNDNLALVEVNNSLSIHTNKKKVIKYQFKQREGYDLIVIRVCDFNADYNNHFKSMAQFFNEDEIDKTQPQNINSFISLLEVYNSTNVYTKNRDSLSFVIYFPEGFLGYICDAANDSRDNIVDFSTHNFYEFENENEKKTITGGEDNEEDDATQPPVPIKKRKLPIKIIKNCNKSQSSLLMRGCEMVSTFGGFVEYPQSLSSCRGWFKGIIEVKQMSSASSKFMSYFLRPDDMSAETYINDTIHNDESYQLTKAVYIISCPTISYRHYVREGNTRTSRMESSYEMLRDKEVYIEMGSMEIILLNRVRFLLRGIPKRVIDMDWITCTKKYN